MLVAVESPSLQRLIGYLLDGQAGLRLAGRALASRSLTQRVARLAPDVIVVDHRLQRSVRGDVLIDLKRVSPSSALILLTDSLAGSDPHELADACLPEDTLVRHLLPAIRSAVPRTTRLAVRPASAGRRPD